MRKSIKPWLAGLFCGFWLGSLLFYWWLVSKVQLEQMVAAACIGLATALVLLILNRTVPLHSTVKPIWLGILLWRLPGTALRDIGILAAELWRAAIGHRPATGVLKELPFDPGNQSPESSGRRALVLAGISLPPNTIALAVRPDKGTILVHQLVVRSESSTDKEWPL